MVTRTFRASLLRKLWFSYIYWIGSDLAFIPDHFLQRHALTGSPHRKTKTRNLQIRTGTSSNPIFFAPATKTERILLKYPVNKRMLVIQTGKFGPCIYHVAETLFLSTICSTLIYHRTFYLIQSSYVFKKMWTERLRRFRHTLTVTK